MKKKLVNIENYLFYFSYFLFLVYSFFGHIALLSKTLKFLTDFSLAIILFVFILGIKNYKKNELFKLMIVLVMSILYLFTSNDFLIFKFILILIVSKNISFDQKAKYDFLLRSILLIIMYITYKAGVAPDVIGYKSGIMVHSMGFTNPNVFGMHTFILCLELLYINRESLSLFKIIIAGAIMLWCNSVAGSRTAFYMFIISLVLFIIYKYKKNLYNKELIKKGIIYSSVITSIIIFVFYLLYSNNTSIGLKLDELMSSRLMLIKFFASKIPISIFGTDMTLFVDRTCDVAIVYSLFTFGIVGCLLYMVLFVKLFKKLYKENEIGIVIVMLIFVIYGLSEKLWMNADYNILITAFSYLIFYNNSGVRKIEKQSN